MAAQDMLQDPFYRRCIALAQQSDKPREHYGALFTKHGDIFGEGWNRAPWPEDLVRMGEITHAEVASLNDALRNGVDPAGADVYVAGYFLDDEMLNIRTHPVFTCDLCPDVLRAHDVRHIVVPTIAGWAPLTLDEALASGRALMTGLVGQERSVRRRTVGATGVYLRELRQ